MPLPDNRCPHRWACRGRGCGRGSARSGCGALLGSGSIARSARPRQVETPADVLARERFGKYRGLKSMRTSPWDPMESLPRDYAKVYAFDNFAR